MKNYIQCCKTTEAPISPEIVARLEKYGRHLHACCGVHTEGGELHDRFKRIVFYGEEPDFTNAAEEIGDIFWYLGILCDALGITFEQCMEANIAKLAKRYERKGKFDEAAALKRNLEGERQVLEEKLQGTPPDMREGSSGYTFSDPDIQS